ncbi:MULTISPECIES: hypothetical protein [Myroides]|uniref:Uncharacterized protein n=1 Tax=Myroides albus TaxID=2562892 RepID=A0A6I3LS07_9FLAO|nr:MULTISPECIES: hypothetical protein [Myroides]MTG98765.1 hypothetical protein [Myroides albus]MVX35894.1 hypothetical protein [Myroides sp. LoEW2-1]UVD79918.1 hypothetical protein NWE55_01100 [Myroides albus]
MAVKQDFLQLIASLGQDYVEQGFVSSQKGQMLKKRSKDSELELQIRFQPVVLEKSGDIQVNCFFAVQSERLQQWRFNKYRSKDNAIATLLLVSVVDLLPPDAKVNTWVLTSVNKENLYLEIKEMLSKYLAPLLFIFEETLLAVELISEKGWRLTDDMNIQQLAFPIDFLLCYTDIKTVERVFNLYLQREGLVSHAKRVYKEMRSSKYMGFIESTKKENKVFQLAFLNGLHIYN